MLKTLSTMQENIEIRNKMENLGISFMSKPRNIFSKIISKYFTNDISIGELNKSWDVYEASKIIEKHLEFDDPVLDMGAYGSEVLLTLNALGFRNLSGIDLNPAVTDMPLNNLIKYKVGDFYSTGYPDSSFSAITSISAIEHGCNVKNLLNEVKRLLKPGGVFIASTDYWPEKIKTSNIKMFGLDWVIFSRKELKDLIKYTTSIQMPPLGVCDFEAKHKPIECAGQKYTFALFVLIKR
jgi:SAM-dependent methyltransferase